MYMNDRTVVQKGQQGLPETLWNPFGHGTQGRYPKLVQVNQRSK